MTSSSVAVRRSIRWVPGTASEPTDTLVLTGGKSGVFLDIRFLKNTSKVDWAFAGYRHQLPDGRVQFKHHIDSRTLDPLSVKDIGDNTVLEGGETLEVGEMINPDTGLMTSYEEVWEDKHLSDPTFAVFLCNVSETAWHAQVGDYQMGLGRNSDGSFWAWQAVKGSDGWDVIHSAEDGRVDFLPMKDERIRWAQGEQVEWNESVWNIIELQ